MNKNKAKIIAEIGVNHNGDLSLAKQLILRAKECNCDAVKFQSFNTDQLANKDTPKVKYQRTQDNNDETHYEMLKRLELSHSQQRELINFCKKHEIQFISTPYDVNSAEFLVKSGVSTIKIASADIVDFHLHKYLASTETEILMATGMATMAEIKRALSFYNRSTPQICLLHCVSNYPCSLESINMNSMIAMKQTFNTQVGFSDHSEGFLAAVAAVAMGATVIEKHFTLDKTLKGPDHRASSTPQEMQRLVNEIRNVEVIMGAYDKQCQSEEESMKNTSRKKLFLVHDVKKDQVISINDFVLYRSAGGIDASNVWNLLGKAYSKDLPSLSKLVQDDCI